MFSLTGKPGRDGRFRRVRAMALLTVLTVSVQGCAFIKPPFTDDSPKRDWAEGNFERQGVSLQEGQSLSYVRAGEAGGQRVIFIHGSPGFAGDWVGQLANVPPGREYFAVDRLGYGFSEPREAEPDLKAQAAALAPLLDTEDGRPVVLVGFSLGGPVAVRAALDYPGRVGGLVLGSSNLDPALESPRWYNEVASWWIISPFLQTDWRNSNREILPHRAELEAMAPRLAEIDDAVAILHSEEDSLVPVANTDFMQREMVNAEFVSVEIVNGAGHMLPIRQPQLTAAAIDAVIAGMDGLPLTPVRATLGAPFHGFDPLPGNPR